MAIVDNAFREWIADFKAANPGAADSRAILDTAQYAFAAGRKAQREIDAARQPVESEENVAADTYWTLAEMIEPHVQREGINPDGVLPAPVHDSVAILLKHWLRTRQPVGQAFHVNAVEPCGKILYVHPAGAKVGDTLYAAPPAQAADSQPVGEPVAWLLISEAGTAIGATRHARERESWEAAGGTTEPLYATPRVQDVDGYQDAFYELADMLGIPAQPCSPKAVWEAQMRPAVQAAIAAQGPVPMVLHCPRCHLQHIDAPDERTPDWQNPPHRSHLCHGCGMIWRPADVPTIGVERTHTAGKKDTPLTVPLPPPAQAVDLDKLRALADRWATDRSYSGSPADDLRAWIDSQAVGK